MSYFAKKEAVASLEMLNEIAFFFYIRNLRYLYKGCKLLHPNGLSYARGSQNFVLL
jgi:hypothetical protein